MKSTDFTNASIEKAVEAIKKHQEEFNAIHANASQLSVDEVAQQLIIDTLGDAQIEAEEIVNDLKKGLSNFDAQFNQNKKTESINVKDYLNEATKNHSEEERKNCYVNILTAIQLLNADKMSQDDVEATLSKNANLSTEELIVKIEETLNDNSLLEPLTAQVKDGVSSEALSQIARVIELHKEEYRLMAAVYLYIEQRKGNLQVSESEFGLPAENIGALAGAAIEMLLANNALQEGKMDLATWQKVVKWILGAVVGITLGCAVFILAANVGFAAMSLLLGLFGTSTVAIILSFIAVCYIGWFVSEALVEIWDDCMKMCNDVYDNCIGTVTEKVSMWLTALKNWIVEMTNKTKSALQRNKETESETQPEVPHTETQTNESDVQMQPAMA